MRKDCCENCIWFNQDSGSCRCFNPKQTDENLKKYAYWNFYCDLIQPGERKSDEEMGKLGYIKTKQELKSINGEDLSYYYFKKK